jgi:putative DNA primase/helicase
MRASDVTPRSIEWLWHPYIPLGKISVVAGQMGQAKSLLTVWLAAYTTPYGVVMMSAEDDPADTIRPRLDAAGADLERVEIAETVTLNAVELGERCDDLGNVRLITVDPISAYLPANVNSWKSQDVRLALEPLRQLAAERELAVVLIQHLNRRADGDPLTRISDSQGVPQLARSVMIWGPDPSDAEGDQGAAKVLTRVKGNLARGSDASATFTIVEKNVTGGIKAPALLRGDDAQITPDDVIADHETRSARDEAVEWLRELLNAGPVPAKEAIRKAREVGISDSTLKRAKRKVGISSEPSRDQNTIGGWTWRLQEAPTYTHGPLDTLDTLDPLGKEAKGAKGVNKTTDIDAAREKREKREKSSL